jgi:hypothetical protein
MSVYSAKSVGSVGFLSVGFLPIGLKLLQMGGEYSFSDLRGVATQGAAPRPPPGFQSGCSYVAKNVGTTDWGSWGSHNLFKIIKYGHQHVRVLDQVSGVSGVPLYGFGANRPKTFAGGWGIVLGPPGTPIRTPYICKCLGTPTLGPHGQSGGRPPCCPPI